MTTAMKMTPAEARAKFLERAKGEGRTKRRVARPREFVAFQRVATPDALWVELPLFLPTAANVREHFAVKAKRVRRERTATRIALGVGCAAFRGRPVEVTLVRIAPRAIRDIFENLPMAFKAVKDEIAAWLGIDDGDEEVATWMARQERRSKTYGVRIEIRRRERG